MHLTADADTRGDQDDTSFSIKGIRLRPEDYFHRVVYPRGRYLNFAWLAQKKDTRRGTPVLYEVEVAAVIMWSQYMELDL